jgi:hypothetical protein
VINERLSLSFSGDSRGSGEQRGYQSEGVGTRQSGQQKRDAWSFRQQWEAGERRLIPMTVLDH